MARFPYQYININGIPTIEARRITVTDTAVDFQFNPDSDRNPFRGLLLVYFPDATPEGTTTTLPVTFTMAGNTHAVTLAGGEPVTVADLLIPGVHLVYYDRFAGILQLIG
jgi:hypothetical protein